MRKRRLLYSGTFAVWFGYTYQCLEQLVPWRRRQHVPPKRWCVPINIPWYHIQYDSSVC